MKDTKYKIIIFGKNIYREHELSNSEDDLINIGTTKNCKFRFNKENFFGEFEFNLVRTNDGWQLIGGDSVYFTVDGVMKIYSKDLSHGDEIIVKYQNSNDEIFRINFFIDFDLIDKNYERIIDISQLQSITIGGTDRCNISIIDTLLGSDTITLSIKDNKYYITDNNTKYGVYINGKKIDEYSEILDYDFFELVGYSFYLKDKHLYTARNENLIVDRLNYIDAVEQKSAFKYPKFNRSTRVKYVIPSEEIEVLQPITKPQKPKKNVIVTLLPALAMLALIIMLRGSMGGGGSFIIYSAATMSIGVLVSIITFMTDGKSYKKSIIERKEKYLEYIKDKEKEIQGKRSNERRILEKVYRSNDDNITTIKDFGKDLFERDLNDEDFMFVRLGTGINEANCKIKYTKQEFKNTDDDLVSIPEEIEKKYRFILNSPIISKFSKSNTIGIVGKRDQLYDILKTITLDITTRQFYKDVKLFYMFKEEDSEKFAWLRWLKNVNNEDEDNSIRNLMYDEESRNYILENLFIELSKREARSSRRSDDQVETSYVIFVFDKKGIEKHPVSKYIETCNKYNFTFVFFEEYEELLPKGCSEIIRLDNSNTGCLLQSDNGDYVSKFEYPKISDKIMENSILKLSAVSVDAVTLESELTKNISLFELLNIMSVDDLDLTARWSQSRVYNSMAAPLGVKTKNQIVYLDLNEKHHGPHGLVAGTTGSGKSEILQTYILSMATLFHPYEVGFMIIDFKGGGMVNQFRDLPHLIGSITNIDGREIDRSLLSIKAELRRRQEMFSRYDVNHIDAYIKLYRAGKATDPIPHLIIIVDEFAELKSEYPEFMKELISTARIGRSLGVHLILATQKPSGVVDNQIWSNSKFKLCLKVQTKEDSNEVIKTPLAAEIVEPGRAYLQVGNNEIFELFQSAYSGAKAVVADGGNNNVFELNMLNLWGKKKLIYSNKKTDDDKNVKTQLQAIIEYVNDHCKIDKIKKLAGICQPPLENVIYLDILRHGIIDIITGIMATVGIYDDPEQQLQTELNINLSNSNTFIIGSSQSGKTTMLQTMIYSIMDNYTPLEVNIYVIDCGNMAMKVFENSNHIGGIVLPAEEERISNLFRMLHNEIDIRKTFFSNNSVGTFEAYKEAGFKNLPQILLIIDNISAFREYYPLYDDELLNLSREGQSVGINIITTATQTNAMGYKTLANFGTRIAYTCNDKGEYSNIFDRCRTQPKDTPGRALYMIDKHIVEFQTALCVKGDKEIIRAEKLKAFVDESKAKYSTSIARQIPEVPEILKGSEVFANNRVQFASPYEIPIGIDYSTVTFNHINLLTIGMLAIMGREKSGKTNFIKHIMTTINKTIFNNLTEAYVFDSMKRQLESVKDFGYVKQYTIDTADIAGMIDNIIEKLENRQSDLIERRGTKSESELLKEYPLILLVIENSSFIEETVKDKELYDKFSKITKQLKNLKIAVIFTNLDNAAVVYGTPEIVKQIKENKKVILFDDIANLKFIDISLKQEREFSKPIKLGDGYLCFGGEIEKIKTILNE
ncbi:type VII secretion protein EssC [Clostridium sp.]|uniref:type VII secretion protein EssC n=1 Tax=Clostridium sp. TaxID=1506 RepID=UPI003FD7E710